MNVKISGFDEVKVTKEKTLVLCDIDDTVLHYPNWEDSCRPILIEMGNQLSPEEFEKELQSLKNIFKVVRDPEHTDFNGFVRLLDRLKDKNGKLMFLTARTTEFEKGTRQHLKKIGLNSDEFEIHFTSNKITKGEYIKQKIDLSDWDDVIFIDDYESYIKTVTDLNPQIKCYKFIVK